MAIASSGPEIAPAESIACRRPKAEPTLCALDGFGEHDVRAARRDSLRQSIGKTNEQHLPRGSASANRALRIGTTYPLTTSGLRRAILSVQMPEKSFAKDATLSAIPSMMPSVAGPPPILVRNAGRIQ